MFYSLFWFISTLPPYLPTLLPSVTHGVRWQQSRASTRGKAYAALPPISGKAFPCPFLTSFAQICYTLFARHSFFGRAHTETFDYPTSALGSRSSTPWRDLYKDQVHGIMLDYARFASLSSKLSGAELDNNLCLQLALIPTDTSHDHFSELKTASAIPLASTQSEEDKHVATAIGGPAYWPTTESKTPNDPLLGQLVLSDFDGLLTTWGALPGRGTVSVFYDGDETAKAIYDGKFTTESPCKKGVTVPLPMRGIFEEALPRRRIGSVAQYLSIIGNVDYEIAQQYEGSARHGSIAIESTYLIGGQTKDFQGNYSVKAGQFLLLQVDFDQSGPMWQIFVMGSASKTAAGDFGALESGNSLCR